MNQNNNKTLKNELEDLQYELSIVLEAMLLYAGVKREKLENAIEAYIDNIDNVLENSNKEGVDEILEVVEFLKNNVGGKIKCRKRKIKCRIFATNYLSFNLKLKL